MFGWIICFSFGTQRISASKKIIFGLVDGPVVDKALFGQITSFAILFSAVNDQDDGKTFLCWINPFAFIHSISNVQARLLSDTIHNTETGIPIIPSFVYHRRSPRVEPIRIAVLNPAITNASLGLIATWLAIHLFQTS
ncbi:hypothetical protein C8J56DRAFT_1038918 [Mycena floridula]|nr:hypothetical protein C8J56DRAFT_1038918 [Mycena floridula]